MRFQGQLAVRLLGCSSGPVCCTAMAVRARRSWIGWLVFGAFAASSLQALSIDAFADAVHLALGVAHMHPAAHLFTTTRCILCMAWHADFDGRVRLTLSGAAIVRVMTARGVGHAACHPFYTDVCGCLSRI
jgi:hypothetical protein